MSFLAAGIYLIISVNTAFENVWFKLTNALVVIVQLLSYLNVAVSNPGILLSNSIDITEEKEQVERYTPIYKDFVKSAISVCPANRIIVEIVMFASLISTITALGHRNALEATI